MTGIVSGPKPIEPMPLHGGPRFMFPRCWNLFSSDGKKFHTNLVEGAVSAPAKTNRRV